jgi:glycosyltransferase involved in cell wall biosynthesis
VFAFEELLTSGSLLLALSFGCVPVAPDWPMVREVLPPEVHGLLYRPGQVDALADRLLSISRIDVAEHERLRSACMAAAEACHPRIVSRRFEEALDALA